MKLEIYQVGKLPPLTVVECDNWILEYDNTPRLKCFNIKEEIWGKEKNIVAVFVLSNIAGFKEVLENESKNKQ